MFKKIVIGAAAASIAAVLVFLPTTLFVSLGVAVAIALAATGATRAAASGPLAAPSLAIAFAVACICFTVIVLADISARAPVRISEQDHEKGKVVAMAAGKALAAIDLQNANGRAALAEGALKIAAGQRDAAEAKVIALTAKMRAAPAQVASRAAEPVGIPPYVAPERWRTGERSVSVVPLTLPGASYKRHVAVVRASCNGTAQMPVEFKMSSRDPDFISVPNAHERAEFGTMLCRT